MKKALYILLYIAIFITISGGLATVISINLTNISKSKFLQEADAINKDLDSRVDLYYRAIVSTQAFFYSSSEVTEKDYYDFLGALNIKDNFSGINAVSFTKRVKDSDKQAYIDSMKNDTTFDPNGHPNFAIIPETTKDEYYIITFVESETRTGSGYDISENPERFETIKIARDSGFPSATGKVASISADNPNSFVIIFAPLYKNGMPIETIEQRQEAIYGVLNIVFDVSTLFDKIFVDQSVYKDMQLKIYEGDGTDENTLLWESENTPEFTNYTQEESKQIQFANRIWTIKYKANLGYGLSTFEYRLPVLSLGIGIIISILLILLIRFLITSRKRAEDIAHKITEKLRVSEKQLQSVIQGVSIIVYSIDRNGVFTLSEGKGLSALNLKPGEVVGKSAYEVYKDNPSIINDIKKALSGDEFTSVTNVGELYFENHFAPIIKDDNVEGLIGVAVDITEKYKIQQVTQKNSEEIKKLNEVMVGREMKMVELKKEILKLQSELSAKTQAPQS